MKKDINALKRELDNLRTPSGQIWSKAVLKNKKLSNQIQELVKEIGVCPSSRALDINDRTVKKIAKIETPGQVKKAFLEISPEKTFVFTARELAEFVKGILNND